MILVDSTIEYALEAIEKKLEKAGISTRIELDKRRFHGCVLLECFDARTMRNYFYRRRLGKAAFRNFVRSISGDRKSLEQATELLIALRDLQDHLEPLFEDHCPEIPEVTNEFVDKIIFENAPAWPDELHSCLPIKFEEMGSLRERETAHFESIYQTYRSARVPVEHALKNAVETACLGPWIDFCPERAVDAFRTLREEIEAGKKEVALPMLSCIDAGRAWRLRCPLWRDGFHGFLFVVVAAPLDTIREQNDEIASYTENAGELIARVLARHRLNKAWGFLRQGENPDDGLAKRGRSRSDERSSGPLRQSINHLLAPDEVEHLKLFEAGSAEGGKEEAPNDPKQAADGTELTYREAGSGRIIVRQRSLTHVLEATVKLHRDNLKFDPDLCKIAAADKIRELAGVLDRQNTLQGRETKLSREGRIRELLVKTENFLESNRERRLSGKDFSLAFFCLAICERGLEKPIQIGGNTVRNFQDMLAAKYKITRKVKSSNPKRWFACNLASKTNADYVEEYLEPVQIRKSHGGIRISITWSGEHLNE